MARWQKVNPLGRALRDLKSDGVGITANYVGNFAANPVGGMRQGTAESHWIDAGVELDLDKLLGLSGTTLHIQGAAFGGTSLASSAIGNSISFQQTWRPVPGPRLTQFNIDKDFFGKRLNIMVGRAALNTYFAASLLNPVVLPRHRRADCGRDGLRDDLRQRPAAAAVSVRSVYQHRWRYEPAV